MSEFISPCKTEQFISPGKTEHQKRMMAKPLSRLGANLISQGETFCFRRTAFMMLDFGKCRFLLTEQQSFAVLQRTMGPNSAGDSENRESIVFCIYQCAMAKVRWWGISTAILWTLD